ncbi:NblA/ycf18 family protein [Nostoc sp. CHAB 5836]|uniref:NblA/ycf18 family protein n=1 Tax=Nostoc sp. CHAB 5836 TaxID=2780404 RepID=UPI001E500348|nr:NblA/ycf18 family protein [Nostoc sp. CHAB 5836]MCC5619509.1 NblA/ycf18 family protein [Nostoc sp. CHAB 5836]
MNQPIELSLEQEFSLRTFSDLVQQMSREQAQEFLLMFYKQMVIKEKTYQELLKHRWEIDCDPILG